MPASFFLLTGIIPNYYSFVVFFFILLHIVQF